MKTLLLLSLLYISLTGCAQRFEGQISYNVHYDAIDSSQQTLRMLNALEGTIVIHYRGGDKFQITENEYGKRYRLNLMKDSLIYTWDDENDTIQTFKTTKTVIQSTVSPKTAVILSYPCDSVYINDAIELTCSFPKRLNKGNAIYKKLVSGNEILLDDLNKIVFLEETKTSIGFYTQRTRATAVTEKAQDPVLFKLPENRPIN